MVQSVDHITGATGLTPTVTLRKLGGSFFTPAGAVSEVGAGWYQVAAASSDADTLGPLLLHATAPTADPRDDEFLVVDYNPTIARITTVAAIGPASITALEIIERAFDDVNVRSQGEQLPPHEVQDAFKRLNNMVGSWATQSLTSAFVARDVFTLTANQATYSIGPGGEFDTPRPVNLEGAGLLLNSSTPPIEIPRSVITDDMFKAIAIKDLASLLFTTVYYNATYDTGLGSITLWPVPTTGDNDLVIYRNWPFGYFATLTTRYNVPPGYEEALEYNLAQRLLTPYARNNQAIINGVIGMARTSLANIKRVNLKPSDLNLDPAVSRNPRYGYNIVTGSGGM